MSPSVRKLASSLQSTHSRRIPHEWQRDGGLEDGCKRGLRRDFGCVVKDRVEWNHGIKDFLQILVASISSINLLDVISGKCSGVTEIVQDERLVGHSAEITTQHFK